MFSLGSYGSGQTDLAGDKTLLENSYEPASKIRGKSLASSSLCNIVWQPFSSEKTVQYLDLVSVLRDISAKLAKANYGSTAGPRAAGIWRAFIIRAL
jgi:hypothetical protein